MLHPANDLETLYRDRFGAFLSTVTALLGNAEEARDVVQDAFATALKQRQHHTGSGSLEAWVWRIVVNRALDRRRARTRTAQLQTEVLNAASSNGGYDEAAAVRAQLLALPDRQRLAVFLRYYADLDYEAIARVLEISPGTVGAALNHARSTLRVRLKEEARE
jgi:RNA polymerase sigma-70 factor (ECF subfamily)